VWLHREDGAVLDDDIHFFHSKTPRADSLPQTIISNP